MLFKVGWGRDEGARERARRVQLVSFKVRWGRDEGARR